VGPRGNEVTWRCVGRRMVPAFLVVSMVSACGASSTSPAPLSPPISPLVPGTSEPTRTPTPTPAPTPTAVATPFPTPAPTAQPDPTSDLTIAPPYTIGGDNPTVTAMLRAGMEAALGSSVAGSIPMGMRYVYRGDEVAGMVFVMQFPDGAVSDAPTFLDSVTGGLGSDVTRLKILGQQVRLGRSQGQVVAAAKHDRGVMMVFAPTKREAKAILTALIEADTADAGGTVDGARIAALLEQLAAHPKDTATLQALADEYYAGEAYARAGHFLDKLLAIQPDDVQALLARGAVSFNLGHVDAAETTWKTVIELDPKNVEAHYDLGFLYLNLAVPDWAGVQREWNRVIDLDPTSELAKTVKGHLDSLAAASMLP
jgi:hypothetical protein